MNDNKFFLAHALENVLVYENPTPIWDSTKRKSATAEYVLAYECNVFQTYV